MAINTRVVILPLGYIGKIVERGTRFTVQLSSGTLVLCTAEMLRAT